MAKITEKVKDFFTNAHVNIPVLHDLLSEFLAVEMGGQTLYERALEVVSDIEVRAKFREFHKQTVNHQKILTDIIRKLGGNPQLHSAGAKLAADKAKGLLRTMSRAGLSKDAVQLNAIENIVLAETKDHADWELLGKIVRQTTDSHLREVLGPAVHTVEQEEDEHLNWTRKKLGDLQMESLTKASKPDTKSKSEGPSKSNRKKGPQPISTPRSKNPAEKSGPKSPVVTGKRVHRASR
jgi:rubrerythrin